MRNLNPIDPGCYPVFIPGDVAPTVLCDHDPAYDADIQRWEDDGGIPQ